MPGLFFLLHDRAFYYGLFPLYLVFAEDGVEDYVGKKIKSEINVFLEDGKV